MKAAICNRYGPPEVVRIAEWPDPEPKPDDVRIRVHATTVSAADYRIRGMNVPFGYGLLMRLGMGWNGPRKKILGVSVAGVVDHVGANVSNFAPGDPVLAKLGFAMGGHAELVCANASKQVVRIPDGVSFSQAAALPFGFTTARHFMFRKGALKPGERVLINGASGAVGTTMVQLAKQHGAHVTGICSGANADLVRELGADEVIDYQQRDFRRLGRRWDVIADNVGNVRLGQARRALNRGGRFLMIVDTVPRMLAAPFVSLMSPVKVVFGVAGELLEDVQDALRMTADGRFRPVIDREFAFGDIARAHAHAETGPKVGNVVVRLVATTKNGETK